MPPTISICIPCYRSEKFIRTTIESVLAQTVPADEIIISDDQSPDRSFEIIEEYRGFPRVKITRPPERTTLGGHYRFLLEQATSDYVCFLSSDDAMHPEFLETMHKQLEGESNVSIIAGACYETDANLKPLRVRGTGGPKRSLDFPESFAYFKQGCVYTISFSLLARRVLLAAPPIPKAGDLATDWCWAMLESASGRVKFQNRPLGYYRIHSTNAGHNQGEAWEKACVHMLTFLQSYLPKELGDQLKPSLENLLAQIERTHGKQRPPAPRPSLKVVVSGWVKSLLTLPHRRLPYPLQQSEAGISTSLRSAGQERK
ncbi:MAG: glycosyltransferase [Acidobacteriaceae bacterium]|nr:glycosyltransferase [Acidobacteriaceae bacterium]